MTTTLITGADKGLGHETARRLIVAGHTVYMVSAVTIQFAKAYPGMRVDAVDPGCTNTDLNGGTGTQTVAEGAAIIVRMAQVAPDGPTGTFVSAHGPVAW